MSKNFPKPTIDNSYNTANELTIINQSRLVENIGVEPMTSCLQSRRSSQLS